MASISDVVNDLVARALVERDAYVWMGLQMLLPSIPAASDATVLDPAAAVGLDAPFRAADPSAGAADARGVNRLSWSAGALVTDVVNDCLNRAEIERDAYTWCGLSEVIQWLGSNVLSAKLPLPAVVTSEAPFRGSDSPAGAADARGLNRLTWI